MTTHTQRVRRMGDTTTWPNDLTDEIQSMLEAAGINQHYGQGAQISTDDSAGLATSKALAKALADAVFGHANDTDLHVAADATMGTANAAYVSTPALPADLTEVQNILNEVKTEFNLHIVSTTYHRTKGGLAGQPTAAQVTVATANATDQSTSDALANALKAAYNRHVQMGFQPFVVD